MGDICFWENSPGQVSRARLNHCIGFPHALARISRPDRIEMPALTYCFQTFIRLSANLFSNTLSFYAYKELCCKIVFCLLPACCSLILFSFSKPGQISLLQNTFVFGSTGDKFLEVWCRVLAPMLITVAEHTGSGPESKVHSFHYVVRYTLFAAGSRVCELDVLLSGEATPMTG